MSTLISNLLALRWPALSAPAPGALHELCYPLAPMPRVAVLGWRFQPARNLVCLERWHARQLDAAAPESLAASPADLNLVAALRREGLLRLPHLAYPLVALLDAEDDPLTEEQVDQLWQRFGLPIRQQFHERSGRLLAYDCEAASGFHVAQPGFRLAAMWDATGECGCGDPAPRLEPARRARAATAIL